MLNNDQCCCERDDDRIKKVMTIIEEYKNVKGALIPVLHEVQGVYGYLPETALNVVSEELKIPMTEIYGVATFYHSFSLEPKEEPVIKADMVRVC